MITNIIKYYLGDQIKMDGMGRVYGMHGGKINAKGFWKEKETQDLGMDGRTLLNWS
jgi:hypothetical protein